MSRQVSILPLTVDNNTSSQQSLCKMCEAGRQYNSWCDTESEVIKGSYTWSISNFSFLSAHEERKIKSSIFSMGDSSQYKWRLRLYPNGCEEGTEGTHISLFLQLVASPTDGEVPVKFDFAIIKADRRNYTLASQKIRKFYLWKSLGYHELIDRNKLLDPNSDMMRDDCLKLVCEVSVYTGVRTHKTSKLLQNTSVSIEHNLARNMETLLQNQQYSDVTLVAGGRRFPAHKAVLSARSPVFAAMFGHDMQEASRNEVVIKDVEGDVLEELVRFIYSGRAEKLESLAAGLLAAADKYAVDDLKVVCERVIFKNLTLGNAMNAYILADRHNAQTLKEKSMAFMQANSKGMVNTLAQALTNQTPNRDDNISILFDVFNKL